MAWRRIEVTLRDTGVRDRLDGFFEQMEVFDSHCLEGREVLVYRVTLHGEQVEAAMDKLREAFGEMEGYRVGVVELNAVDPRPDHEASEVEDPTEADDSELSGRSLKMTRARISRDELLDALIPGSRITRVYLVMNFLAAVVATAGLIKDSAATVIGAMVIAPLLQPNMSMALGTTIGDLKMVGRSFLSVMVGSMIAVSVAALIGWGSTVNEAWSVDLGNNQIRPRLSPTTLDLAVALAAGAAGAVAVTTGVAANLIGVMVAVALVPPLAVMGLLMGVGRWDLMGRAGLTVGVTLVSVNLAGVVILMLQGVREQAWQDTDRARSTRWVAIPLWLVLLGLMTLLVFWTASGEEILKD